MGIWIALYLIEHLFTNSQLGWIIGNSNNGFVRSVNWFGTLPYLPIIEIVLLGIPISYHMIWGIIYMFRSKYHMISTSGKSPSLSKEGGNRRFAWQRWTAWILVVGLFLHVAQMRFIDHPHSVNVGSGTEYLVKLDFDKGLYKVTESLNFKILDKEAIKRSQNQERDWIQSDSVEKADDYSDKVQESVVKRQLAKEHQELAYSLAAFNLKADQVVAMSSEFGVAILLVVRDTFKHPLWCILYTLFVLAACFHAYNGLWTFLISWGVILTKRSQVVTMRLCIGLMVFISFLGLSSIWLTYWVNLR